MNFKKLVLLFCMSLSGIAYGELLVVEKSGSGTLVPVAPGHRDAQKIADILLAYQWPMVAGNANLTEQERDELLTPGIPYAEENFIRRKLQQLGNYDVIFIPTVVYELFCLNDSAAIDMRSYRTDLVATPLHKALGSLISGWTKTSYFDSVESFELRNYISEKWERLLKGKNVAELYRESFIEEHIYDGYKRINELFYKDNEAFFYVNEQFFNILMRTYPELLEITEGMTLSDELQSRAHDIAFLLIKQKSLPKLKRLEKEVHGLGLISTGIIFQSIELEYGARVANKGLLIRGSELFHQQLSHSDDKVELCASTLYVESSYIMERYRNKALPAYSVSFGNSFFAGFMRDETACAYYCLTDSRHPLRGYALFIDKKEYVLNNNNHLFMVAPLANLSALFSEGEFFHSRTKTTARCEETLIKGLIENEIVHHPRLLIIRRDPLEHERLFEQFFIENACIITSPELLRAERTFKEAALKANHKEALRFYTALRQLSRFVKIYKNRKFDTALKLSRKISSTELPGPAPLR